MRNNHKVFLLFFIAFLYFFSNGILTRLLYPLECKGIMPYLVFRGENYNFIDLNLPHFFVFIIMGAVFKFWAFLFGIFGEILQALIKHTPINPMDIALNLTGAGIGILIRRLR